MRPQFWVFVEQSGGGLTEPSVGDDREHAGAGAAGHHVVSRGFQGGMSRLKSPRARMLRVDRPFAHVRVQVKQAVNADR